MQNIAIGQEYFASAPYIDKGLFPVYAIAMIISELHYKNALETIEYIRGVKEELANMLLSKTCLLYSGIPIVFDEYKDAVQCINETIDDLYRSPVRQARYIIECWERNE